MLLAFLINILGHDNREERPVFLVRMDIPIQVWHMVEVMRRGFNEHHITKVPLTVNQLGEMQMMEEKGRAGGNELPRIPRL